jgi:hypothetical protein
MNDTNRAEHMGVSRRRFMRDLLAAVAVATGSVITNSRCARAVSSGALPAWLSEARTIVDRIINPRIPSRTRMLMPVAGDSRAIIQQTIDDLNRLGGGRVLLGAGLWRCEGGLRLTSNIELHLDTGADLVFSGEAEHYLPVVHTRWEGTELFGYMPCLYAYHASNVAVTGQGTISVDKSGSIHEWRREQKGAQQQLRAMGAEGRPLEERVFGEGKYLRPSCIQFFGCHNVLVEGVLIRDLPFWGVHLVFTHHATVRDVSIQTSLVNNDGVDIDSSTYVLVERCRLSTGDDSIAIKSGRDRDGRHVGAPSEDIVIRDCTMTRSKSGGIAIGSEMSGGVRRVYVLRCTMGHVETAVNIKSNLDRGGVVEHLRVWNLSVTRSVRVLQITTSYHGYAGGKNPPLLRDIEIDDVRCDSAEVGITLLGVPEAPIERVVVKGLTIRQVKTPLTASHIQDVSFTGVLMNGTPVRI